MFCAKCHNDVIDCVCDDIEERLSSLSNSPQVASKWCKSCDKHHEFCKCKQPDWWIRLNGKLIKKFNH